MDATTIAWVAGLVEGEGNINMPVATPNAVRVKVSMTDHDVVRRLQEVTGMGRLYVIPKRDPKHKTQLMWQVHRKNEVARLLCAIAPLMGERRRESIARAAERLSRCRGRAA